MEIVKYCKETKVPLDSITAGSVVRSGDAFYLVGSVSKMNVRSLLNKDYKHDFKGKTYKVWVNLDTGEVESLPTYKEVLLVKEARFYT